MSRCKHCGQGSQVPAYLSRRGFQSWILACIDQGLTLVTKHFSDSSRCPAIQLNSDTVCLQVVSDFTGWGLGPTRLLPNSDANHKFKQSN